MLVSLHLRHRLAQLVLRETQADALGEHRHAERPAVCDPLEHRGLQDVDQMRQLDGLVPGEFLGDHREGGPGGLPDAHGQVAG